MITVRCKANRSIPQRPRIAATSILKLSMAAEHQDTLHELGTSHPSRRQTPDALLIQSSASDVGLEGGGSTREQFSSAEHLARGHEDLKRQKSTGVATVGLPILSPLKEDA